VDPAQYYAASIQWAYGQGIVSGVAEGRFAPEVEVSRQDLAVMMHRFCLWTDIPLPPARPAFIFGDRAAIAPYAKEAVAALCQAGVLNGKADGQFDPTAPATRAEVAALVRRVLALW
jgi:hypothetical protein